MKNGLQFAINSFVLLLTIVVLSSCGGSTETTPSNVIKDGDGIKVDLDWTTAGSTNDALNDSDLDLFIHKGGNEVLSSKSASDFERITFDPDLYADGDYVIKAYSYEVTKNTDYIITINGVTVTSKPYKFTSNFTIGDNDHMIDVLTVNKSGSKYTITPIN